MRCKVTQHAIFTLCAWLLPLAAASAQPHCSINGQAVDCPTWFAPLGLGLSLFSILVVVWAFVFWIYMLVHCLRSDMDSGEKLVWVVVMLFASIIGSIIYYFVVKRAGAAGTKQAPPT